MKELGSSFFSKVYTRQERERAFGLLLERRLSTQCQCEDGSLLLLQPLERKGGVWRVRVLASGAVPRDSWAIFTFSIKPEVFFFRSRIYSQGEDAVVDLPSELFKLQRRESFRLPVPASMKASVTIEDLEGKRHQRQYVLHDLSGGGCSFDIRPDQKFDGAVGGMVSGSIQIQGKLDTNFFGALKYKRILGSMGSGLVRFGIEFREMPVTQSEEIIQVILSVHRDLFSQYKLGLG